MHRWLSNEMQHKAVYLLFCKFNLHVSGVNHTHHQESATSLKPGQASLATLEGGSCTKNMTNTGGCSYSFVHSWWWVWLTPETCTANLQNNKQTALCCISLDNYQYTTTYSSVWCSPRQVACACEFSMLRGCVSMTCVYFNFQTSLPIYTSSGTKAMRALATPISWFTTINLKIRRTMKRWGAKNTDRVSSATTRQLRLREASRYGKPRNKNSRACVHAGWRGTFTPVAEIAYQPTIVCKSSPAFTYSSTALQSIRVNETHLGAEVTVPVTLGTLKWYTVTQFREPWNDTRWHSFGNPEMIHGDTA